MTSECCSGSARSDETAPPAEKYVTHRYECLYSENRILQHENEGSRPTLEGRMRNLSAKRQAIDGKHLMTTPDILASVKEAEKLTQIRTQKRGGKSKKRGPRG